MKKDSYPTIFLSGTDARLPEWFSNDYQKYSGFHEIGGGGNGVLYAAYDNNMGRHVAIKKLNPDSINDPLERQRLLREARITAQLQHPCTVPVYEIGKDDKGELYFSMKKVVGENLFQILSKIARGDEAAKREFTLPTIISIVIQTSNALGFAHTHGVIHRDVKPENVLVGLYDQIYLMDWGVAKVWGMPNELTEEKLLAPKQNQRPGTPLYMSPEQVLSDRPVDERTDIFSMGVLLYETLALREPFRGANIEQTFANILQEDPPPPSEVAKHQTVPKEFDAICARALQKSPADRYQNMTEMISDIRSVNLSLYG